MTDHDTEPEETVTLTTPGLPPSDLIALVESLGLLLDSSETDNDDGAHAGMLNALALLAVDGAPPSDAPWRVRLRWAFGYAVNDDATPDPEASQ